NRLATTIGRVSHGTVPLELADRWVQRPVPIDLRDPRVMHLQRHLEQALAGLMAFNGDGLGNPLAAPALKLEQLVYNSSARMLLLAIVPSRGQ
ncbi:MAG: hypothetical protein ACKOPS_20180, partial [Cyanobium sp.]